jgi:DNA-binding response OmpR family regulator
MMAGANSVLTKPVNLKELQSNLARFCPATPSPQQQVFSPPQTAPAPSSDSPTKH